MKWKVCGMRDRNNIIEVLGLQPDLMGFIFYEKSPRFLGKDPEVLKGIDFGNTKKVGVFVNHDYEQIVKMVKSFHLDFVQLHGDEDITLAKKLKSNGIRIIKVFRVKDQLPEMEMKAFEFVADHFLLDTKTEKYGGSGERFDWDILRTYKHKTPLIISGGIDLEGIELLKESGHSFIDVNSKFEIEPGRKSIKKLEALKDKL